MRRSILGLLTIAIPLAATSAAGETLKEQVDRLCHAYIDTPGQFTEIPTRPCTAAEKDKADGQPHDCFIHGETANSQPQVFASVSSGGSCSSISIVSLNGPSTPLRNANVNGYSFGAKDKALEYQGQLLLTGDGELRLVTADEEIILCEFLYRLDGWHAPDPPESELCQKFSHGEYSDFSTPIPEQDYQNWPQYIEGRPVNQGRADLDHDGAEEKILGYSYASGAGCGCTAGPLFVLHEGRLVTRDAARDLGDSLSPSLRALGPALENLTMVCRYYRPGIEWSIVRIDGKDFVLADFQPGRRDELTDNGGAPYYSAKIPNRELYEFRAGDFVKVCEQRPIATKHITHEVVPKEKHQLLNYVPVTDE